MRTILGQLVKGRPVLPVLIGLCDLEIERRRAQRLKWNEPVPAKALIDTSAYVSTVTPALLKRLGIHDDLAAGKGRNSAFERVFCLSVTLYSLNEDQMVITRMHAAAQVAGSEDPALILGGDGLRELQMHVNWDTGTFSVERAAAV